MGRSLMLIKLQVIMKELGDIQLRGQFSVTDMVNYGIKLYYHPKFRYGPLKDIKIMSGEIFGKAHAFVVAS